MTRVRVRRTYSRGRPSWVAFTVLCITFAGLSSGAQSLDAANDVLDRMKENGRAIEDLDATLTVKTYADGEVQLTQQMRLSLLQPDKMRQEYLAPDYFAGNLSVIVGNAMWIYIAASDTWYSTDLSTLAAAEQPWLAFRQILRDVQDELDDYTFDLVGIEDGAYRLRGTPTTDAAVYGLVEMWIDPESFIPRRRVLYDIDGNKLVEVHILETQSVAEGAFLARRMETFDAQGALRSTVQYDSVTVNGGLDVQLFAAPKKAENG